MTALHSSPSAEAASADPEVERYLSGECHVFAVAMHRETGWPIHVVLDEDERYWTDPMDDDNWIPAAVHVLCVDPAGMAWDILGPRPLDSLAEEVDQRWRVGLQAMDICPDETALRNYVGCWGEDGNGEPIERPLAEFGETDIRNASAAAIRTLEAHGWRAGARCP